MLFHWILSFNIFDFILPQSLNLCFIIDLVLPQLCKSFQIFKDFQRLLAGLQNQYTCYSINLAGGRITLLAMEFISPFHLIDQLNFSGSGVNVLKPSCYSYIGNGFILTYSCRAFLGYGRFHLRFKHVEKRLNPRVPSRLTR